MFGFVGQSSKMDSRDTYDSYIKIVPPLKRSAEVLVKTLQFFGWTHVAMIGGGLETNTWDKVDDLWRTVENQLKTHFNVVATVKFDTSNPHLVYQKIKYIAKVTRGQKSAEICSTISSSRSNKIPVLCSYCDSDQQRGLHGSAAGGRAAGANERRLHLLPGAAF